MGLVASTAKLELKRRRIHLGIGYELPITNQPPPDKTRNFDPVTIKEAGAPKPLIPREHVTVEGSIDSTGLRITPPKRMKQCTDRWGSLT